AVGTGAADPHRPGADAIQAIRQVTLGMQTLAVFQPPQPGHADHLADGIRRQAAEPAIPVQQLHMPLGHAGGHCKLIDSAVVSHALDSPELGWPVCRIRLLLAPVGGTLDNKAGGWIMAKMAGIPIEQWAAASRDFMFGEHRLRYWEAGSGEPLLLIHGFPSGAWDWHYLWQPLAERYRVIACDMLGFGFSAKPRGHAYGLLEQADIQQ